MNNEEGDNVMKSESYVSALFERSETYRFNKKILSDINSLMEQHKNTNHNNNYNDYNTKNGCSNIVHISNVRDLLRLFRINIVRIIFGFNYISRNMMAYLSLVGSNTKLTSYRISTLVDLQGIHSLRRKIVEIQILTMVTT